MKFLSYWIDACEFFKFPVHEVMELVRFSKCAQVRMCNLSKYLLSAFTRMTNFMVAIQFGNGNVDLMLLGYGGVLTHFCSWSLFAGG